MADFLNEMLKFQERNHRAVHGAPKPAPNKLGIFGEQISILAHETVLAVPQRDRKCFIQMRKQWGNDTFRGRKGNMHINYRLPAGTEVKITGGINGLIFIEWNGQKGTVSKHSFDADANPSLCDRPHLSDARF